MVPIQTLRWFRLLRYNGSDSPILSNDILVGIDEFHHTSADAENGLGDAVRSLMTNTNAHIVAMTGSYFRGDGVPVLRAEDEARFCPVTYNYYQQLNGYRYLKTLGIGYKFYQGSYLDTLPIILDTTKKTIIHIPSVNSRASTGLKFDEVNQIINCIGKTISTDFDHRIIHVKTSDGRILKVGNLVENKSQERNALQHYLRNIKKKEDLDIIIALGTAKEGFDWQWCEHCLTIGVRGSLTEIVQIIGRCTRDCERKEHAQFTNMIAMPDAKQENVQVAVNDMLKAITSSLLMEQVMAPSWNFKTTREAEEAIGGEGDKRILIIEGLKPLSSVKTKMIIAEQLDDLKATILQDDIIVKAIGSDTSAEVINKVLIPKIIKEKFPDLTEDEIEEVRQRTVLDTIIKGNDIEIQSDGQRLLRLTNKFINIDKLNINMIDSINPFQRAYEILSKNVDAPTLKIIQDTIAEQKYDMSIEEAILLFKGPLKNYIAANDGNLPDINNPNIKIKRLAQAFIKLKNQKIRYEMGLEYDSDN